MNNTSYIIDLIGKNKRIDGRKLTEYRKPIKIETGISKNAEGSARVLIGETEVIVGVKLDVGTPFPDTPDEGAIVVTTELLPLSSPVFEAGPPDAQATELARIVDRGIRESKMIDLKKLCIKEKEKVWIVYIDIYTINDDGNLIDASALAALAALRECRIPKYDEKEGRTKYGEWTDKKVPITKTPITVTLIKIKDKILVDPNSKEEEVMDSRLTVAIADGKINAMQKGGDKGIMLDEIDSMIELAIEKAKELKTTLK